MRHIIEGKLRKDPFVFKRSWWNVSSLSQVTRGSWSIKRDPVVIQKLRAYYILQQFAIRYLIAWRPEEKPTHKKKSHIFFFSLLLGNKTTHLLFPRVESLLLCTWTLLGGGHPSHMLIIFEAWIYKMCVKKAFMTRGKKKTRGKRKEGWQRLWFPDGNYSY